ncbi:hypothetical protein ROA7450_03792 [Roseovarius albus]|uniref:Uncharacterized protein n=2 Tax=Roseovarius albus TaxID=1247867 RepID=A0A1X7A6A7_9RHOB|nr:hypothetical protein ROA7450_03792 [Roseovarius albus]
MTGSHFSGARTPCAPERVMHMQKLTKQTLTNLCSQMASHTWTDDELDELVDPKLGIITGFQDLLDELETLRQIDLGTIPPAQSVQKR